MPAASPGCTSHAKTAVAPTLRHVSLTGESVGLGTVCRYGDTLVVVEWRVRLSSSARNQRRLASCPALNSDHFRHSQSL